jgi:tRNA threonylcarbamoyl adenosine modification protein (Sua5/YciO/YrdC/YwlC family)
MRLYLHPDNPPQRQVSQLQAALNDGALICYPTDSTYAFGWLPQKKEPAERVARIRKLSGRHLYALACRDLKQASDFGKMDNRAFSIMKAHTPGPYTFILPATSNMPKRLVDEKRKTIGVRIPANNVVQALLKDLSEPLMTSSLTLPANLSEFYDIDELCDAFLPLVDYFVDGGHVGYEPTTLIDLTGTEVTVVREGKGPIDRI